MGGLLGLLLGGSAISVFEIIDLFVYNFLIQLTYVRESKRQKKKRLKGKELEIFRQQEILENNKNNLANLAFDISNEPTVTQL